MDKMMVLAVAAMVGASGCSLPEFGDNRAALENWPLWGIGQRAVQAEGEIVFSEEEGSMLISPHHVKGDCTQRFD